MSAAGPDVDAALVERVKQGDVRAFEMLVVKYQRRIERLIGRMVRDVDLVADIAQETFIRAYRALPQFRGDSAFYTWLYRIAVNTAKKALVDLKRDPLVTEAAFASADDDDETSRRGLEPSDMATPDALLASKESAATVNAAIPADGLTKMSEDDARYAIATDFTAYLMSAWRAAKHMGDHGDIILIGSFSAHILGPHSTVYAGMKYGIQGFAEALRKELGNKGIKVGLIEPAKTGADFQLPDIPVEKQREMINEDKMLRAEDIAVAAHFMLTQPRRTAVSLIRVETRLEHP